MAGVDWAFIHKAEGYWLTGYVPNVPDKNGRIASGVTVIFGYDIGQHSKNEIMALPISEALKEKLYPFCEKKGANAVQALEQNYLEGVNRKLHQNFPKHVDELARHNVLAAVKAQFSGPTQLKATPPRGVHESGRLGTFRDPKKGEKVTQFVASETWHPGLTLTQPEADELATAVQGQYYAKLERNFNKACKGGKHLSVLPPDVQTALMSLHWQLGSFWAGKGARKEFFDAATRGDWADAIDTLKAAPFPNYPDRKRRREEAELIARAMGIDFKFVGRKEGACMLQLIEARSSYGNIG
ncbi:MAG: pesticin C-terminus-like muramidase [Hyphomicrobiales bacterium]